jgi:hypothetical protein
MAKLVGFGEAAAAADATWGYRVWLDGWNGLSLLLAPEGDGCIEVVLTEDTAAAAAAAA